ncbi:MAG: signal peptidase II [Ignavibacteria bacterium]|jgi:signal peptidase II
MIRQSTSGQTTPYLVVAFVLVLIDQITKVAVKGYNLFGFRHEGMHLGESFPVFGEIVRITFVENPGMAFGVEFGSGKIVLTLFSLLASFALVYYLRVINNANRWIRIAIMLILAGAFGNFIDRMFYGVLYDEGPLFYGLVVDFIQIDIPDITIGALTYTHWPVFNVADSCVTTGMILLILFNKHLPYPFTAKSPNLEIKEQGGQQ